MSRASIVPHIISVLEPYLEDRHRRWLADPGLGPTLPVTGDKVNVRQIVRELAKLDDGIRLNHEQHFFKHPELAIAVNRIAEEQGLAAIGSRSPDDVDAVARQRMSKVSGEASELRQALAEREATIEHLRRQNETLREQLRMLEETGVLIRTGPIR